MKEFPTVYDTDPHIFGKSCNYFQIVGSIRVKLGDFLTHHTYEVMLGTSPDAGPVLTHIISEHRSPQYFKIGFNIILPCVPRFLKWSVPIRKWPNPTEADSRTAITLHGRECVCVCMCVLQLSPFLPARCISYCIIAHAWPATRLSKRHFTTRLQGKNRVGPG